MRRHSIPEGPGAAVSFLPVYFERGKSSWQKTSQGLKAKTLEGGDVHILLTSGDAVISSKASSWIHLKYKKLAQKFSEETLGMLSGVRRKDSGLLMDV